jgi:hypothetical protein
MSETGVTFRRWGSSWWQVWRGGEVIAGLSALTDGSWLIVDTNDKQLSAHHTLYGAKKAARKMFA